MPASIFIFTVDVHELHRSSLHCSHWCPLKRTISIVHVHVCLQVEIQGRFKSARKETAQEQFCVYQHLQSAEMFARK